MSLLPRGGADGKKIIGFNSKTNNLIPKLFYILKNKCVYLCPLLWYKATFLHDLTYKSRSVVNQIIQLHRLECTDICALIICSI